MSDLRERAYRWATFLDLWLKGDIFHGPIDDEVQKMASTYRDLCEENARLERAMLKLANHILAHEESLRCVFPVDEETCGIIREARAALGEKP